MIGTVNLNVPSRNRHSRFFFSGAAATASTPSGSHLAAYIPLDLSVRTSSSKKAVRYVVYGSHDARASAVLIGSEGGALDADPSAARRSQAVASITTNCLCFVGLAVWPLDGM